MPENATLFVDESGDPGWSFDKPYVQGGSSRHLTIAGVIAVGRVVGIPEGVGVAEMRLGPIYRLRA